MVLGWITLTVAMVGDAKLLWDILIDGFNMEEIWAKIISLGLTFLLGWVVCLICIRPFGNRILPILIQAYIFLTVGEILVLYGRVAYKFYIQQFVAEHHYMRYSLAIGIGFAVLVGLHLLIEYHDLRPFSIPFLVAGGSNCKIISSYIYIGLLTTRNSLAAWEAQGSTFTTL